MVRYIKCPRCELNYIDAEKQEYCDVCLKELKGIPTDADELEEAEDLELATELCPVCGENMMRPGEKMCDECKRKTEYEEEPEPDEEEDDEWRNYLDDDTDIALDEELSGIDENFDEEFGSDEEEEGEEEEEEYHDEEEDLEYVTGDEIYTIGDDEDDEEEDDDEDF